jgi:hypothetical protein
VKQSTWQGLQVRSGPYAFFSSWLVLGLVLYLVLFKTDNKLREHLRG